MKRCIWLKAIVICLTLSNASFAQKGLLWEVSGKGITHPAYLYGSIHMYDTTEYHLPAAPFAILDKVKSVYFELDLAHLDMGEMMRSMMIPDSTQYINKLMDPASLEKLKPLLASSAMLSMMGEKAYAIKPLLLWSFLIADGTGGAPSIDMELYKAAVEKKNTVGGLETIKEEMDALNTISIPAQVKMLEEALVKGFSPKELVSRMTAIYTRQRIETLMTELNDGSSLDPNFDENVLVKRNIVMVDRMEPLLHKDGVLVCIGAGHLGTKTGILELLKKKGYTLKNIPFNFEKND